jgi:hypothetical protein
MKPWNIDWVMKNTLRKVTGKKSLEQERQERMAMLREILSPGDSKLVRPAMNKAYFSKLAEDFTVSSVVYANQDGSVVASNTDRTIDSEKSILDSALKQIPDTKYLLIKGENKTHIVYPNNGSLLVVEAPGNVSPIEMMALLRQIRKGEK